MPEPSKDSQTSPSEAAANDDKQEKKSDPERKTAEEKSPDPDKPCAEAATRKRKRVDDEEKNDNDKESKKEKMEEGEKKDVDKGDDKSVTSSPTASEKHAPAEGDDGGDDEDGNPQEEAEGDPANEEKKGKKRVCKPGKKRGIKVGMKMNTSKTQEDWYNLCKKYRELSKQNKKLSRKGFLMSEDSGEKFTGSLSEQQSMGRYLRKYDDGQLKPTPRKRNRERVFRDIEEKIMEYLDQRANAYKRARCGLSWTALQKKSLQFADILGHESFQASSGWLADTLREYMKKDGEIPPVDDRVEAEVYEAIRKMETSVEKEKKQSAAAKSTNSGNAAQQQVIQLNDPFATPMDAEGHIRALMAYVEQDNVPPETRMLLEQFAHRIRMHSTTTQLAAQQQQLLLQQQQQQQQQQQVAMNNNNINNGKNNSGSVVQHLQPQQQQQLNQPIPLGMQQQALTQQQQQQNNQKQPPGVMTAQRQTGQNSNVNVQPNNSTNNAHLFQFFTNV